VECEKAVSIRVRRVDRDSAKYKLDSVDELEVRWDKENTVRARDFILFYSTGK
jgi:hypothetical protein